jgi:hypothetical protein
MRRLVAFVGLVAVLALALTLLWRVYVHHTRAEPYDDGRGALVGVARSPSEPVSL